MRLWEEGQGGLLLLDSRAAAVDLLREKQERRYILGVCTLVLGEVGSRCSCSSRWEEGQLSGRVKGLWDGGRSLVNSVLDQ